MSKERNQAKAVKYLSKGENVREPRARLRSHSDYASAVEVDPNIPPQRYYRSGAEMIRLANMHMQERNYESAYILYMKFITIFLDKIMKHPLYHTVSLKDRAMNQQTLRTVFPKAEELKNLLLEQYQAEYDKYIEDAKERERLEKERQKQEELERLKEEEERKNKMAALAAINAKKAALNEMALLEENKMQKVTTVVPKPALSPPNDIIPQTSNDKRSIPTVDRSTKPLYQDLYQGRKGFLLMSDNQTLRDVVLPTMLMHKFLTLAFSNTVNNKETCGILAGKLERNKLVVTHLLIPEQTGSPDSCVTHYEEDIFDYQDQHNLITLGWIHTHPTQTAFLSSVDLHTHCAYQLLMAEALAIVCAPKYNETGFFILTPDYGLDCIANCRESGFHPHPQGPPLYMKANHYRLEPTAPIEVVDLRRK